MRAQAVSGCGTSARSSWGTQCDGWVEDAGAERRYLLLRPRPGALRRLFVFPPLLWLQNPGGDGGGCSSLYEEAETDVGQEAGV